eukprot:g82.t1
MAAEALQLELKALEDPRYREPVELGAPIRASHFALGPSTTYLNHGGLGLPPLPIMHLRTSLQHLAEEQPMHFHRDILPDSFSRAKRAVADYLDCEPSSLSLLQSASVGLFHVLRSLHLQPGDIIVVTSVFYHSVADTVRHLVAVSGATLLVVQLKLPIKSKDTVIDAFTTAIDGVDASKIRIAVLDHISSKPSIVLPIHRLLRICKQRGILTLVDGAHAPGQVIFRGSDASDQPAGYDDNDDLCASLRALGADFYGNQELMPERFSGVDVAILSAEVPPRAPQDFDGDTGYVHDHIFQGIYDESTREYSSFLVLPAALALLRRIGMRRLFEYSRRLAVSSARRLSTAWGTELAVADDMTAFMSTVELPSGVIAAAAEATGAGAAAATAAAAAADVLKAAKTWVHRTLLDDHGIEVPIFVYDGALFTRVSAHIYNHAQEVDVLASAVLSIASNKGRRGSGGSGSGGSGKRISRL